MHGLYAVHEGSAIIIAVPVAEVEGEPIAVNVLEVAVAVRFTLVRRTVVDILPAMREIELGELSAIA